MREQVRGGERSAAARRRAGRRVARVRRLRHRVDDRDAAAAPIGGRGSVRRPVTMMPVDPAAQQRLDVVPLPDRVVAGVAQQTEIWPAPSASSAPSMTGMLNRPKLSVVIRPTV